MRWFVALLGAALLVAGSWLTLRLTRRPELRVALNLRTGDPDDAALAAGVDLALEEREFGAGRYRLKTAHQSIQGNSWWNAVKPTPGAHTMLHGVERPDFLPGPDGPLLTVHAQRKEELIRAWMRGRNLERFAQYDPLSGSSGIRLKRPDDPDHEVLESRPDAVLLHSYYGADAAELQRLRAAGFQGPIFLSFGLRWSGAPPPSLPALEGARFVLAPLKPAPPDFLRRHPHPFVYAGYLGTLRYLDALDRSPNADFYDLARRVGEPPIFDTLLGEPRIFVVRNGRLVPD